MTLELPFPPKELSPNARLHWRALDRAKKAYKDLCAWKLLKQPMRHRVWPERIALAITINPPDRRRRDRDNLQHSLKYALDMLAVRMGVDDYRFDPAYTFGEPVKGGRVTVTIGEAA